MNKDGLQLNHRHGHDNNIHNGHHQITNLSSKHSKFADSGGLLHNNDEESPNDDRENEELVGLLAAEREKSGDGGLKTNKLSLTIPTTAVKRSKVPSRMTQTGIVVSFIILLGLIMVWDMNKMYEISGMIHDDHNDLWERMNDTAIRTWWSPLDICLLKMNDSSVDVKSYRAKNCNKLPGLNLSPSNDVLVPKLFCNAGSSLGKACPAPLNDRHYFGYRLRDVRYRDGRSTHLSDALKSLAKRKMPLVFVGDGLTKQNEDALICDLLRTDGNTVTILTGLAFLQQKLGNAFNRTAIINAMIPDYVVRWKGMEAYPLEIKYFKLWAVEDDANNNNGNGESRHRVKKQKIRRRYLHHPHEHEENTTVAQQQDYTQWQSDSPLARSTVSSHRHLLSNTSDNSKAESANGIGNIRAKKAANMQSFATKNRTTSQGMNNQLPSTRKNINYNNNGNNNNNARAKRFITTTANNTATLPQTKKVSSNNTITPPNINYNKFATPTIRLSFQQVQEALEIYTTHPATRAVALIANVGVFYNSREKFREEVPFFLSWLHHLQDTKEENLIFYRETAAQHWNHTDMGYYDETYREESENNGTCVPIADNRLGLDWRNEDVYHMIENEDFHHIRMIPFHLATMPLYNMHPTGSKVQDCTHYCYFPQMWQPVWYALYNATMTMHY